MRNRRSLAAAGAAAAYAAGLLIAPQDGTAGAVLLVLLALIAAASVAAIGYPFTDRPGDIPGTLLLGWAPVHLLLLATGGMAGPLPPLLVLWSATIGLALPPSRAAAAAAVALALLLGGAGLQQGLTGALALEATVALGVGHGLGLLVRRGPRLPTRPRADSDDGDGSIVEGRYAHDAPSEGMDPQRVLTDALESVRAQTRAGRVVLWEIVGEGERARPRLATGGELPRSRSLAGDPMRWVQQEQLPLRLERPPRSMLSEGADAACIVPLSDRMMMTLDFAASELPADIGFAEDAGRYLASLLSYQQARVDADEARRRSDRVVEQLRQLGQANNLARFASSMARIGVSVAGGSGASVVTWDDESGGIVLATVGDDGGPRAGGSVPTRGNEMALAARSGAPIVRRDLRPGRRELPLTGGEERWHAEPRALGVVPLVAPDHRTEGVLAVWNADLPDLEPGAVDTLRTIASYASLQLRLLAQQAKLRERVDTDALTGLPNRGAFNERLAADAARCRRYQHPLSLILFDIDHFKRINDEHGHDAGDHVLVRVAGILTSGVREADLAARFGGEEFVMLLPETNLAEAAETADRLRRALEATEFDWKGARIPVSASMGVSAAPACVADPAELVTSADAALYHAKEGGRNRVVTAERVR